MEMHSRQGPASPPAHFFLEPTIRVQAAAPEEGNPGQRFLPILPPSALPAGETMQGQSQGWGPGQILGLCPGQAPRSFPGEPGSAAGPALFRGWPGGAEGPELPSRAPARAGKETEKTHRHHLQRKTKGRPLPPPLSSAK